jgi:hypothetical protein
VFCANIGALHKEKGAQDCSRAPLIRASWRLRAEDYFEAAESAAEVAESADEAAESADEAAESADEAAESADEAVSAGFEQADRVRAAPATAAARMILRMCVSLNSKWTTRDTTHKRGAPSGKPTAGVDFMSQINALPAGCKR